MVPVIDTEAAAGLNTAMVKGLGVQVTVMPVTLPVMGLGIAVPLTVQVLPALLAETVTLVSPKVSLKVMLVAVEAALV